MKTRTISIKFDTDASDDVVEEIAFMMKVQLEALNDGTLYMDDDESDCVDEEYENVKVKIK